MKRTTRYNKLVIIENNNELTQESINKFIEDIYLYYSIYLKGEENVYLIVFACIEIFDEIINKLFRLEKFRMKLVLVPSIHKWEEGSAFYDFTVVTENCVKYKYINFDDNLDMEPIVREVNRTYLL